MSFLDELKRRRVVRVALVYAATAFVVLQAADLLTSGLELPRWVFAAITVATVLGFPLALVLAWAFQITPEGVQRTGGKDNAEGWLSRRTVAVIVAALLLVIGGGWFLNPALSDRFARLARNEPATGARISALVPPPGDSWYVGRNNFEVSPDGRVVAFVGQHVGADRTGLILRELDSFTTTHIAGTTGAQLPFWSPDGRSLGFFADGDLRVMDLASREVRTLCPAPAGRGATWGARDVILYTPTLWGVVHRTSATGGGCEPVPLRNASNVQGGRPYFLQDGRRFIISAPFETWMGRIGSDSLTLLEHRRDSNIGGRAVYAAPDHLLVIGADGGLHVRRLDVRRQRLVGPPRRLLEYVGNRDNWTAASASMNGTMVVIGPGSTTYRILLWTDAAGTPVDSLSLGAADVMTARPSLRGDRVALGGQHLEIYDRTRGVATVLHGRPRYVAGIPVWAPGDTMIAFQQALQSQTDSTTLELVDVRTGVVRALFIPPEPGIVVPTHWSPDGRLLAFALIRRGANALPEPWVYDFAAGEARRLFDVHGGASGIRFSPDGRWIAWESAPAQGTRPDVFLRPADGTGAPVRVSAEGGMVPRWSPDGRELYYRRPGEIMVVSVRPDATPMLSAPRLLRTVADGGIDFEPTADGGIVLDLRRGGRDGYTLLQDWTKLLDRQERR